MTDVIPWNAAMLTPAWSCERSVDADVPVAFAWEYMTDVRNWNDPPAEFSLDGPFASGSRGTTRMPGSPPAEWTIRDVEPGHAYTIEGVVDEGVVLRVRWFFDRLEGDRARLTQRIELTGDGAARHVAAVRAGFEPNIEPGMRRIAALMTARANERSW
jgi:hypothetical protein